MDAIRFETHPDRYRHWKLRFEGEVATLDLDIPEDGGLRPGYVLKQNSYDLGVDIELADAIQRIRFEHPEVKALVVSGAKDRVFCSGANIYMLGSSTHAFKVNFCKFTNETRLYLEDLAEHSGVRTLAALTGACAGGGYELAMACERILLVDDGSSAVSLPEVPLLGVLPGTGGLTRLVDKRKVRRDLADAFSTVAEGVRGKRALAWGLVDRVEKKSGFSEALKETVSELVQGAKERTGQGVTLTPLAPERDGEVTRYRYVELRVDAEARVAHLSISAPEEPTPSTAEALRAAGADAWALRMFRELDDALLDLRFNHPQIGLLVLRTTGSAEQVLASDASLIELAKTDWFASEILLHMRRVLKRLDLMARTVFAIVDQDTCFAGSLLELALAADRSFMLDVDDGPTLACSELNFGALPMASGLTRLEARFYGAPEQVGKVREHMASEGAIDTEAARELGLVTYTPDDIDWEDEVRIAMEERAAFSPDALTGMEASLRFVGPETLETKIFGRLSAWQNWIFQRPNAVGERGGLTTYGTPERPKFNFDRT
ncbi:MAG: 2,3-epoxybenzoyl-CoA dihydrolase [Polyangiaceae bacterium]|nr:2,3-epoxybenzoyl-CoA dihydrolase [Polyangiaceae bacterium]MCW5788886.1 2,3-epoxybenzoyl-CoA dihydrolase [Polyangiaceae bacterium]